MATGIPRRATCLSTYEDPDEPAQFAEDEQVLDAIFRDAVSSGRTDAQRPDAVFRADRLGDRGERLPQGRRKVVRVAR